MFLVYRKRQLKLANQTANKRKYHNFGSKSLSEYLLGSRKLYSFPVGMSLVGSYISAVTVLGTPAEVYNFGTQYFLIIVPVMLMGWTISQVYLPVFCTLKVGSSYEVIVLQFTLCEAMLTRSFDFRFLSIWSFDLTVECAQWHQ